jgi:hypothetical protein
VACGEDTLDDVIEETGIALPYDLLFIQSTFSYFSNVSTTSDQTYLYIESNGTPDHQMMVGITTWIDQFPTPHKYTIANNNA